MAKTREPLVLRLIDVLVRPFLDKNLDYATVREILKLKLVLDKRRVPISQRQKEKNGAEPKETSRSMLLTCIMYMFLGLFIASFQLLGNIFVANIFGYGALMFMLLTVYIGEYSSVLLDTTEKAFFGSLPIGKEELNTAKNIHIAYYIGVIAVSVLLPSVIAAAILHGFLYMALFTLVGAALVVFCLHLSGGMYYLLLKIFSGERLKDILNAFQVIVTVAIVLGYQIIPRIVNFRELASLDLSFNPFLFALPPAWFAAIFAVVFEAKLNWYYYILTAIGIFSFVLLETAYKGKITKEFEGKLDKLTEEVVENKSLSRFSRFICKVMSKDRQEKAFMELVLIQVSRDRNIKLKLYPQLANVVILPIIFMATRLQTGGISGLFQEMKTAPYYLALYMVGLSSAGIYDIIARGENKESLMFYQILPISNLSKCIRAGVKVVIFRYLTPLFAVMASFFVAVCGIRILPDVAVIYTAFLFITGLMIRMSAWVLPFSTEVTVSKAGYAILTFLINLAASGGTAFLHFMYLKTLPAKFAGVAVMLVLNLLVWKFLMNKKYVISRG